jgi:hypothetical protein
MKSDEERGLRYMGMVLMVLLVFIGCGDGVSSSDTQTDIRVERGPVHGATVIDAAGKKAVNIGQNIYRFRGVITYPIHVSGGWIDVDGDGIKSGDDLLLDINLTSYGGTVTPLSTLCSDPDPLKRQALREKIALELGVDVLDLDALPSDARSEVAIFNNALFQKAKRQRGEIRELFPYASIIGEDENSSALFDSYRALKSVVDANSSYFMLGIGVHSVRLERYVVEQNRAYMPFIDPASVTLDPIYDGFGVGFGGATSFKFAHEDLNRTSIYMSIDRLVGDFDFANYTYYHNELKDYNAAAFVELQNHLNNATFFTVWVTRGWQDFWFSKTAINNLIEQGKIPVFMYWYFGDGFVNGMPDQAAIDAYQADAQRFGEYLKDINGTKLVIFEPEFNKSAVLANPDDFVAIIAQALDTIKAEDSRALFSLSMIDSGRRGLYSTDESCGYANCALGDKASWDRTQTIYEGLLDRLDFIAFQQMLAQFSRDPADPGGYTTPNPTTYTTEDLGIALLPKRIENIAQHLYETYHKPVFLPVISLATATWNDTDSNGEVEADEVNKTGWEEQAANVYRGMDRARLQASHLFGYSVMALFDKPDQDLGGYQYFMNNEYHMGIIKSSAPDATTKGVYGDIEFKGDMLESIFSH